MARTTYVEHARPRFRTVPVLNEDGTPKVTPVLRKDGTPRVTKSGRPVTRRVTVEDKSRPLPLRTCESCGKVIEIGSPYKWVKPKSGPYGGSMRVRCRTCPTWQPWELSNALWAQIQRVTDQARKDANTSDAESVAQALRDAAEGIREIAEAKRESAQNVEDGFQHPTEVSEELSSQADELESWADEIDSKADEVDTDEPDEEVDCDFCDGTGSIECPICHGQGTRPAGKHADPAADEVECDECDGDGTISCPDCDGSGQVDNDEHEEWLSSLEDALTVLDESPV